MTKQQKLDLIKLCIEAAKQTRAARLMNRKALTALKGC